MWKFIHPFINLWDPSQIADLCWSSQHDKVQERLFERKSAGCAPSRLSLQSVVMEWWMLWRTDRLFFPHLCSLLTCPVARAYSSLLFLVLSKLSLLAQKLPVIAHLIPASVINKSKIEVWENLHIGLQKILHIRGDLTRTTSVPCVLLNYWK